MAQQTCGQREYGTTDVWARRAWHNRREGKENMAQQTCGQGEHRHSKHGQGDREHSRHVGKETGQSRHGGSRTTLRSFFLLPLWAQWTKVRCQSARQSFTSEPSYQPNKVLLNYRVAS